MSKLVDKVTIGSDPEVFLFSEAYNKFVPVCGLLGGTKDAPLPISDNGHFIQEDNVAAEYCIPPCGSEDEFVENIMFGKTYIETRLKDEGLIVKCVASAHFKLEDLESEQARTYGCDPDFNAYTLDQNQIDKSNVDPTLRSAGFHIHIGFEGVDPEVAFNLVKAFDLFMLVPSVLIDPDTERRQLYGKAGSFRLKSYGVECRGLSSYFLSTEELIRFTYRQTMKAIEFVNIGGIITNEDQIQECINSSNQELAREIVEDYRLIDEKVLNFINI